MKADELLLSNAMEIESLRHRIMFDYECEDWDQVQANSEGAAAVYHWRSAVDFLGLAYNEMQQANHVAKKVQR